MATGKLSAPGGIQRTHAHRPSTGHTTYHCAPPKWRAAAVNSIACSNGPRLSMSEPRFWVDKMSAKTPFFAAPPGALAATRNGADDDRPSPHEPLLDERIQVEPEAIFKPDAFALPRHRWHLVISSSRIVRSSPELGLKSSAVTRHPLTRVAHVAGHHRVWSRY